MTDANGLRFEQLAGPADWRSAEQNLAWDRERRSLRLVGRRALPTPAADDLPPSARLDAIPAALDSFGSRAFWDEAAGAVLVRSEGLPGAIDLFRPPDGQSPTDLAVGTDGVLYVAIAGGVVLVDLRDRWDPVRVEAGGDGEGPFEAWRVAVDAGADAAVELWALDRENRRLGRLRGRPFPRRPGAIVSPGTWRPRPENPDRPTLTPTLNLAEASGFAPGEIPVDLASSPEGRLAVVSWSDETAGQAVLHLPLAGAVARLGRDRGQALLFPYSAAWLSNELLAVLAPGLDEAAVYRVPEAMQPALESQPLLLPVGDLYPLRDHDGGPFLSGRTLPPHFPTLGGGAETFDSAPLHRISMPAFAPRGEALSAAPVDGGHDGVVWHRIYLEAVIPRHCSIEVLLAAGDRPPDEDPEAPEPVEFAHQFGATPEADAAAPRAAWVPQSSELAFAPALLPCPPVKDRSGLFTVLVQRPGRRVRSLRGRYLRVRIVLHGNGRRTPEVAALRIYGSRFSYIENYLPELYHETVFGPAGDVEGESTPADFLERLVDNFEGILTPLEDRIANAHLLTDPAIVPEASLEWLGSWIGAAFQPAMPEARRRAWLRATPELQSRHGTPSGLALALDVATGGAVSGGEIVILEDFRLRRTFATILGADLADLDDPLLPGLSVSGNSFVGDTLILGEEHRAEFLALFRADLPVDTREGEAIAAFFERLAHRVTVLVHQQVEPQDLGLIERIVQTATPAHVEARVLQASLPFLVGIAALVGVDSYLGPRPALRPVELGRTHIGGGDRIQRPPALDPRLGGGSAFGAAAEENN